jgi:hypothetical protein
MTRKSVRRGFHPGAPNIMAQDHAKLFPLMAEQVLDLFWHNIKIDVVADAVTLEHVQI